MLNYAFPSCVLKQTNIKVKIENRSKQKNRPNNVSIYAVPTPNAKCSPIPHAKVNKKSTLKFPFRSHANLQRVMF